MKKKYFILLMVLPIVIFCLALRESKDLAIITLGITIFIYSPILYYFRGKYLKMSNKEIFESLVPFKGIKNWWRIYSEK